MGVKRSKRRVLQREQPRQVPKLGDIPILFGNNAVFAHKAACRAGIAPVRASAEVDRGRRMYEPKQCRCRGDEPQGREAMSDARCDVSKVSCVIAWPLEPLSLLCL